uniref:Methylated-DNA--protein-cysteine methyltransferase n=1 Tax=Felis catus TaxID=9685 RepID=A0ABI7X611_FELCA
MLPSPAPCCHPVSSSSARRSPWFYPAPTARGGEVRSQHENPLPGDSKGRTPCRPPSPCQPLRGEAPAWRSALVCDQVRGRMDKTCEMSYKVVDSPLGEIEISACEQGVHEIRLHGRKTPDARAVEAPPLPELLGCPGEMTAPLKQCVAWLDAYFHEPAALKDLPLPAIHHPVFQRDSFTRQVLWKLLKVVRLGETVSYRQLAALAGRPRAARAVGGAMRTNPLPILIPCHRVVCSSGAVGNYSAGRATKEWLLAHEGRLAEKPSCPGGSRGGGIPRPQPAGGTEDLWE